MDQAVIHEGEFGNAKKFWEDRGRRSVEKHLDDLKRIYPRILTTDVATGEGASMQVDDFDKICKKALCKIGIARANYKAGKDKRKSIREIVSNFDKLSNAVFSIGDSLPDLKEDLELLLTELSKEPVVHSHFEPSSSDKTYLTVKLNVFAIYLERRYEVEQKLNKKIVDRLSEDGVLP